MIEIIEPQKTVEHDVDILLVEELHVSAHFRRWLAHRAIGKDSSDLDLVHATRSLSDSESEFDVTFVYSDQEGKKHAIFIENKVTAPARPRQAERYRRRCQSGIKSGEFVSCRTLILAPQEYLSNSTDANGFDAQLSYETLREWFLQSTSLNLAHEREVRIHYKAGVIERGITRMREGWVRIADATVTDFFYSYYLLASQEFPHLGVKKPSGVPRGNNEISYKSPELNTRLSLVHKFEAGCVDLRVAGASQRVADLRRNNEKFFPTDIKVMVARSGNKSAAFRIQVPESMDRNKAFDDQKEIARKAMKLGEMLLTLSFKLQVDE